MFALVCRSFSNVTDCIGCNPTQSIFPTNAMKLERFYKGSIYEVHEYITPLMLYYLCDVEIEGSCMFIGVRQ